MFALIFMFAAGAIGAVIDLKRASRREAKWEAKRDKERLEELEAIREGASVHELELRERMAKREGKELP